MVSATARLGGIDWTIVFDGFGTMENWDVGKHRNAKVNKLRHVFRF
jgi:hypothetical protein